jgi:hypothetical protein
MKTTINILDDLLIRAKMVAAQRSMKVKDITTENTEPPCQSPSQPLSENRHTKGHRNGPSRFGCLTERTSRINRNIGFELEAVSDSVASVAIGLHCLQ